MRRPFEASLGAALMAIGGCHVPLVKCSWNPPDLQGEGGGGGQGAKGSHNSIENATQGKMEPMEISRGHPSPNSILKGVGISWNIHDLLCGVQRLDECIQVLFGGSSHHTGNHRILSQSVSSSQPKKYQLSVHNNNRERWKAVC